MTAVLSNPNDPAVSRVVASGQIVTAATMDSDLSTSSSSSSSHNHQRISFSQWLVHEPIAILVISTLMSLAVQRASTRIENMAVGPAADYVSTWTYRKATTSEKKKKTKKKKDKKHGGDDDACTERHFRSTNPSAASEPNTATTTTTADAIESPPWQIQLIALIIDLLLNLVIIYIVYLILVRGGLRPYFGTSR